jgi:hypothetical protein
MRRGSPYLRKAPRQRGSRHGSASRAIWPTVVIALAAMAFVLGAITGRSTRQGGEQAAAPVGDRRADPASPVTRSLRTRDGAIAAATAFLAALEWQVLLDDKRRLATVERFATTGARTTLDSVVSRGIEYIRQAVRVAPVVVRPVPIGYRVDSFRPRRAVVSVWGMALFGTGTYEPVSQWATSTVDLAWQRGAWKVAAMSNRRGPSPRWSIEELAHHEASFDDYRHVP